MDEQWKDYMKRMTLYLAKKGIFRVTISRLRMQGLLVQDEGPSKDIDQQGIEEVLAFDRLMNPLLTYFGKYEGKSDFFYLRSNNKDSDDEEEIDESAWNNIKSTNDIDEQVKAVLKNLLITLHHLSGVKRNSAKHISLVTFICGRMHFLKNRAIARYIEQMEELAAADILQYNRFLLNPDINYERKVTLKSLNFFLDGIRMSKIQRTEVWVLKALDERCPNLKKKLELFLQPEYYNLA